MSAPGQATSAACRPLLLAAAFVAGACGEGAPAGRLALQPEAAARLGLPSTALVRMDSAAVPGEVRARAAELGHELDGRGQAWYFAAGEGRVVALIPSRSFEGEDPHVVAVFGPDGRLLDAGSSYRAVAHYCPARGTVGRGAGSRDSADGCRYITPVPRMDPPPP